MRKYAPISALAHYLFLEAHSFCPFSVEIISADKYPSVFSNQIEAIGSDKINWAMVDQFYSLVGFIFASGSYQ